MTFIVTVEPYDTFVAGGKNEEEARKWAETQLEEDEKIIRIDPYNDDYDM